MSEHFDHKLQAARRTVARYVLNHSGVEIVVSTEEPIPDEALHTMVDVLVHAPLQPISRQYRPVEFAPDGQLTKYDLNDKTVLIELVGRTELIFLPVVHGDPPRLLRDSHDNTRGGIARWAEVRLDKMATLRWWLRRRARSPLEVQAYYAVRDELRKLTTKHWSPRWYGRRFLEDGGIHGR